MRRVIEKNIYPIEYDAVVNGGKTFAVVKNVDDDIEVGDMNRLREWNGSNYTGRSQTYGIGYVTREHDGLKPGYCIIAIY